MEVDLSKEELEFLIRVCKRSIEFASMLGKVNNIFDGERGENIEKCTILHNKLKNAMNTKQQSSSDKRSIG
jgi:hypothetical protein